MGERKVLNKYYPPDFDPAKLPKLKLTRDRQYVVRLMAPFTMRCKTCGNYVYKGKKFNARKEDADGESYLGIQIYRFYIRCPQCLSEITFKTDPESTDYVVEHGAYRTFQAVKLAELEEERVQQEKEDEEANNPMLALENRTKESRREMDVLDALEEIRDWNTRNAQVKFEDLMERHVETERTEAEAVERADLTLASEVFRKQRATVRRIDDSIEEDRPPPAKKVKAADPPAKPKHKLSGLVRKKVSASKEEYREKASSSGVNSLSLLSNYSDSSTSDSD